MATGNTLLSFGAQNYQQAPSSYAYLGARNSHPVILFPDAGDKVALFSGVLPRHYTNLGITAVIQWAAATSVTVTHVCRWGLSFERIAANAQDIDADGFATEKTVDGNPNTISGVLTYSTLAFTNSEIDGIISGEAFRLKVRRITTSVTNNMTGNAQLLFVDLRET